MKKINFLALTALLVFLLANASVMADADVSEPRVESNGSYDDAYGDTYGYGRGRNLGYLGVLADLLLLRPTGLVMTVGGAGLVVATSPFTGLASIAPPHDAFVRVGNAFVVGPAGFTFNRPLGEMSYQRSGVYPVLTRPSDMPVQLPVPVVKRTTAPAAGKPATPERHLYRYSGDRLEYPQDQQEEKSGQ